MRSPNCFLRNGTNRNNERIVRIAQTTGAQSLAGGWGCEAAGTRTQNPCLKRAMLYH